MTQNPILKVLSVMHGCRVRFLLMGGQACILYGGSEFSRDTDIAILPEQKNLKRLDAALTELKAELIAVPQLSMEYLLKGHAVHFRCKHPDALREEECREREADKAYWLPLLEELEKVRHKK